MAFSLLVTALAATAACAPCYAQLSGEHLLVPLMTFEDDQL
jgi:hypothetical protein